MAIADKILTLRKEKGWSQQQLAKKIGTSGPIIGRYERGEMVPSVEVALKLANSFNITLDYLVDNSGKLTEIKDRAMLERLMEIERLENEDKKTIVHVIDSLLRDARAKKGICATKLNILTVSIMRVFMNIQNTMIATNYHEKIIIEKIRLLSPDKITEVVNFIDFLSQRYKESQLIKASNKLAENVFKEVWNNPEDDEYDSL